MEVFFTADEHFSHVNIIKYCHRPFNSVQEMNATIIAHHNEVVGVGDTVYHLGDFTLQHYAAAIMYTHFLHGKHIFLRGSHDYWLKNEQSVKDIITLTLGHQIIVLCHYAMLRWPASHYNSWQLFGHSHATLHPQAKQYDVGVDNNEFYPVSFTQLKKIMSKLPNNPNFICTRKQISELKPDTQFNDLGTPSL